MDFLLLRRFAFWTLTACIVLAVSVALVTYVAFGYRLLIVGSNSMSPVLHKGDAVISVPADGVVHVGDLVTFRRSTNDSYITHRVIATSNEDTIVTQGDGLADADIPITRSMVSGRVVAVLPNLGDIIAFGAQPLAIAALTSLSVITVLAYEIMHFKNHYRRSVYTFRQ